MHRSRLTCAVVLILMLSVSLSMTSCGGGGGDNPDLVLLGFNVPNLSGIPLNQALIFIFSADINPATITPDTLRVVGAAGPFFEEIVVDGNLVALLPVTTNFADYSDAGLQPDIEYTVSLTEFPAVTTIESTTGKPLLQADTFTFRTLPAKSTDIVADIRCNGPDGILGTADDETPASPSFFIETRRAIRGGVPWTQGGKGDGAGCLQNSGAGNELYQAPNIDPTAIQTGSGPGARLLCLQNEGSPRVIEALSVPRHNTQAYGDPSAVTPGFIDLPAIRVKINEPLDPLTVEPFFGGIPVNVQLWRVALKNGDFTGPDQIETNKPIVVQSIEDTEIILVPAGPVPQGVYVVNITPAVKDLPGCPLRIDDRPDPSLNGYDVYEAQTAFSDAIPPGYRIYFKTLEVPDTPLSIIEDFNNNLAEWGDNDSGTAGNFAEPGLYTRSDIDTPDGTFDGDPLDPAPGSGTVTFPAGTRTYAGLGGINGDPFGAFIGQSSTACWNGATPPGTVVGDPISSVDGYRFLNIPTLFPNPNIANPNAGTLQAVYKPWMGNGQDGGFDTNGANRTINTDSGDVNNDGIYEFTSFLVRAGDTVTVIGSRPLLILCQGTFDVQGTIVMNGDNGGPGFDTDGSEAYTNAGAVPAGGAGGAAGPGGGAGGAGADPTIAATSGGTTGGVGSTLFDLYSDQDGTQQGGTGAPGTAETVAGTNDGSSGGGGGGFGTVGFDGLTNDGTVLGAGGPAFGDPEFVRGIALFNPDRGYHNNSNVGGGNGGGGGSSDDDANGGGSETGDGGTVGNGDDGGGGGGGAGGAMWVLANGAVTIGSSAVISANGGDGGNTYGPGDQLIDPGLDNTPGNADDLFIGLVGSPGPASGDGGPGGGGAGGGICIVGTSINVSAGASVTATGGSGGSSGDPTRNGGDGAPGRIFLTTFGGTAPTVNGTTDPLATSASGFTTPVDLASVGQSDWVDLFTDNTDFAPLVGGIAQVPTFKGNFTLDLGDPGFLELPTGSGGGGQTAGTDFDAKLEFQGADFLNDGDGNAADPITDTPSEADGLTVWYDASQIDLVDGKRYIRWRWRFFVKDGYGTGAGDPPNLAVPTVFDVTIPFVKN
ncbi:MAG: hypothetical protein QNJ90_11285 [Planctomycetota bacterium]|nr:hypothetical protein [Planctomycetota bacterium]